MTDQIVNNLRYDFLIDLSNKLEEQYEKTGQEALLEQSERLEDLAKTMLVDNSLTSKNDD
jgi:hypothetical protein